MLGQGICVIRFSLLASLVMMASGAHAQVSDPEAQEYIDRARINLGITSRKDCGKPDKDGAIIVCARRGPDPNRLPLPNERENIAGRTITGEIPDGQAATNLKSAHTCSTVGNGYGCSKGLSIVKQKF